jgi:hypothetical protein
MEIVVTSDTQNIEQWRAALVLSIAPFFGR